MDKDPPQRDREFRASYSNQSGCFIVIIEQFDARNSGEWKRVTSLFCETEEKARVMIDAINSTGLVQSQAAEIAALREQLQIYIDAVRFRGQQLTKAWQERDDAQALIHSDDSIGELVSLREQLPFAQCQNVTLKNDGCPVCKEGPCHWPALRELDKARADLQRLNDIEMTALQEELAIANTAPCFACGAKVTQPCRRAGDSPCGREHLGGTRSAIKKATK
jgi:hypothetical protein